MELARAFTTRHKKPVIDISSPMYIGRAASQRAGRPVIREKISSPLALISTSNTQLNSARNIAGTSPVEIRTASSSSSILSHGTNDSDRSSNHESSGTLTDASSIDESPIESTAGENHLSCYFKPAVDTQTRSPAQSPTSATFASVDTPELPKRGLSHSKKAHESLHRKNSVRRMLSPPASARDMARSSAEFFGVSQTSLVEAPRETPFGSELAQLDEVAEELGQVVYDAETAADMSAMREHNLASFGASDYMTEIHDLIFQTFHAAASPELPQWI